MWLLLQGCGVGFTPVSGTLSGFTQPIPNVEVIRSERTSKGGNESNEESWNQDDKSWVIRIGDSGEAWAKAIGKLLSGKYPASTIVFDLSNIRPAGGRLSRYGWISSGDAVLAEALPKMAQILNKRAGTLLSKMDILDLANWCGVIQTGRRGAEITLVRYGDPEWPEFAAAKKDYFIHNPQRSQSNNSLVFYEKPARAKLNEIFDIMQDSGGSEPGFYNGAAALRRAPWFRGVNPCGEVLLGNKGFCNLFDIDLAKFKDNLHALKRALYLCGRANYRQTCVDLDDGILQRTWHENNEFLRLCGVGLTGIVRRPDLTPYDYRVFRNLAVQGAYSMAEELSMPLPKNVTTIKPSGTVSKIADTTEGIHKPLGRYIFNNVTFSAHDPLVNQLEAAGYKIQLNPDQADAVLVTFPVSYEDVDFDYVDGKHVNLESATTQLDRYKMIMENYVDQNASTTISYSPEELPAMVDWLESNWDSYVGVSFLLRNDPSKSAQDLGFKYLPQEVVTREVWEKYSNTLKDFNVYETAIESEVIDDEACATGACPVR
jgi:ribonucleoside-triphosphate reductase